MWRSYYNLQALYETPTLPAGARARNPAASKPRRLSQRRAEGRTVFTEAESKQILAAYGIPTVETRIATTENDAYSRPDRSAFRSCSSSIPRRSLTRPTWAACSSILKR